jgi:N-methylhydantoinase B
MDRGGRADRGMTVRWVSRETAIADYGVVITVELDDDSLSQGGAANDPARASRPAPAEDIYVRGPGCACLSGEVLHAGVEVVGS